jgi:hypothetical protein
MMAGGSPQKAALKRHEHGISQLVLHYHELVPVPRVFAIFHSSLPQSAISTMSLRVDACHIARGTRGIMHCTWCVPLTDCHVSRIVVM